jgi:hypothetical protein
VHAALALQVLTCAQQLCFSQVVQGESLAAAGHELLPPPASLQLPEDEPPPIPPPSPPLPAAPQLPLLLLEEHPTTSVATTAHISMKRTTGFIRAFSSFAPCNTHGARKEFSLLLAEGRL